MRKPELLAPAGDLERLRAALRFGADAVYVGGPMLQLRAGTAGFSQEELETAVSACHAAGKRLYVTVNSFVKNGEIAPLRGYAEELYRMGVDAVIISDLGAICTVREAVPELEIHVSTQANCLNYAAANHYAAMGVKRIVLGREMTVGEIAALRENTPGELELECFVHGAMCMSYSGRCLLSAYMNGRSGNRGACSQPCRYQYVLSIKGENGWYPITEDENGTTLLSSMDLNAMPILPRLLAAGVSSLKIEGRMKSTYYVSTVVSAYRHCLDGTASLEDCLKELDCASHRAYTTGFYEGKIVHAPAAGPDYLQDCIFVAMVLGGRDGVYRIQQRNNFRVGDTLEVLSPASVGQSFVVEALETPEGESVTVAPHPKQELVLRTPVHLEAGDILRRREKAG